MSGGFSGSAAARPLDSSARQAACPSKAIRIERLSTEIVAALTSADVRQRLPESGAEVVASTPAVLAAETRSGMAVTGKPLRNAGTGARY